MKSPCSLLVLLASLGVAALPAKAIVFYGLGNGENVTDPGTGVPYGSVAQTRASGSPSGSAVHLGVFYYNNAWRSYFLTANHVSLTGGTLTLDGSTFYTVSSSVPVAAGVDLKIVRLDVALNTVPAVSLYSGTDDLDAESILVGWGVGQSGQAGDEVTWGGTATIAHRWGTARTLNTTASIGYGGSSYIALETRLRNDAGSSEAGATYYDSGSGLFYDDGGTWCLTGITTTVESSGSSTFGSSPADSDSNYFVRIADYRDDVLDLLPVPEPEAMTVVSAVVLGGFAGLRRRRCSTATITGNGTVVGRVPSPGALDVVKMRTAAEHLPVP